ncbi:MAG: poly-gamma-glutamate biosynthesis protein PgsC/CapC [Campylobacterota bacterium]|nr:poly-gamma-glutamate biosynthesis protein PgsC/CapC [Campylobacterota bacterium]
MSEIYLPILPSSYLSHSVVTTVWIGIMVIGFFNLRFGWIFSGLVVPGYLTPLLLIKPLSVGVILFESVVTYLFVYIISEAAANRGLWTNFFGRDRFFALLVGSVMVRLTFDGWILPWLSAYTLETYGFNLDYQDSLHSFGLIIVALIANQLWKPKLFYGLIQLTITVGITYIIIRYFFVAYTNFSLSNISYLYEDVAGSILASPKSYIILITTAFIASRMNLFYGWDFNGILVPSLLALQWYQPSKIFISFVEAYIILGLSIVVLKLPIFQNISIEGARKMLLFFNIGFFYKIFISFFIVYFYPDHKVSDYFGFGYLLSTLIAIKMYDKVNIALFTRTTLQTSIVSIVIATTIGYMLTLIPSSNYFYAKKSSRVEDNIESNQSIISYLENEKINLYNHHQNSTVDSPTPAKLEIFKKLLHHIDEDFYTNIEKIKQLSSELNYKIKVVERRYIVLSQESGYSGWGIFIIDLTPSGDLVIEVPYPLEANNMIQSSTMVMKYTKAKALSISGAPFSIEKNILSDAYNNYYSLYHTFHQHYARGGVLQIRRLGRHLYRRLMGKASLPDIYRPLNSLLFIKGYMPKHLHLAQLKRSLENLNIEWNRDTGFSLQKESMSNRFAELYLSRHDRQQLISSYEYTKDMRVEHEESIDSIERLLQVWLLDKKIEIASMASQKYKKPTLQELRFFDQAILTPLCDILDSWEERVLDEKQIKRELQSIAIASRAIGYSLTWYVDTANQEKYIILHEVPSPTKHFWGTYVFGVGKREDLMIQVPRPFYESYTFEYSLELFEQLNAKVLMLSGAHPLANSNREADVMLFGNRENIFNLVSQVIYRESRLKQMSALQIRGKGTEELDEIDGGRAILSLGQSVESVDDLNPVESLIYNYLKIHTPTVLNDGNLYSAGYESDAIQSSYLKQSINNSFSILWLPYSIRNQYRQSDETDSVIGAFRSLNVEVERLDFLSISSRYSIANSAIAPEHMEDLEHYLYSRDIIELEKISQSSDFKIKVVIDINSNQPYLLFLTLDSEDIMAIVKLNALPPYEIKDIVRADTFTKSLEQFYLSSSSDILRVK